MASAWSAVVGAVFATAGTAVAPCRVTRGRDITHDAGDVVMVGVRGIELADWEDAGSWSQEMQSFGGSRQESGTVNGLIVAWNGDGDQALAETTAFGYFADLEAAVRATPNLGLTAYDYLVAEIQSGDITETQNHNYGAATVLSFVIKYEARI